MISFSSIAAAEAAELREGVLVWNKGTGSVYYVKTLADYGSTPDGYVDRSCANTNVLVLQHEGVIDFKQCGAKTDGTDASANIQACFDYCRDNGATWTGVGTFNCGSTSLVNYTAGDGSAAVFTTTADGQSSPVFNTKSEDADITLADASLLALAQAELPLTKGQTVLSTLGAYSGQTIRLASTDDYIPRFGGGNYRHEIYFKVEDVEGNISPPLPYDVANTVTLTSADRHVVREPITVYPPLIKVISGTTDRTGGLLQVERPNTTYIGNGVVNETTAKMAILARMDNVVNTQFQNMHIRGAKEASTNYGYKVSGSGNAIIDCSEADCRRGVDGEYSGTLTVRGGRYPDGVGGHLIHGLTVQGAYAGVDAPNTAPIYVCGGDTSVDNCTLVSSISTKPFFGTRSDIVEHIGRMALTNCTLIGNFDTETGAIAPRVMFMDAPSGSHDTGRAINMPTHIVQTGNTVIIKGTGHTGRLLMFEMDGDYGNLTQDLNVDTQLDIHDNALVFENGTPLAKISGVKRTTWVGNGLDFHVSGIEDLLVYWGASSGSGTTDARADFYIDKCGAVDMRIDGGSTHKHYIECDSYAFSTAAGLTSKLGDEEWWHRIRGSLFQNNRASLADDAVLAIPCATYMTLMGTTRNGATTGVAFQFTADTSGADGVTLHWSTGATVGLYTSVLTGTTGTDAQLNISANSTNSMIYIENRTGAAIPLILMKVHDG